jgi:predicted dehydrogenase
MMKAKDFRVGIVGGGFIGDRHADAWAFIPGARVTAVAERDDTKRTAIVKKTHAAEFSDFEDMLTRGGFDILDVCLPSNLHRAAVLRGFEAGLDVIVEKPFAVSLDDIDRMIEGEAKSGKRLMVAHVCRFKPEYVFAKKIIDEGSLGRPLFFGAWRESETPLWSWGNWLLDRNKSGGTLVDLSIHDLDIANWFLGEPNEFIAREVTRSEGGGLSHVVSSIGYLGGGRASVEAGHLMPPGYPFNTGYRLLLEKGAVECRYREGGDSFIEVFRENSSEKTAFSDLPPMLGKNAYAEELRHFCDCLRQNRPFKISLREARLAVSTALRLSESLPAAERVS